MAVSSIRSVRLSNVWSSDDNPLWLYFAEYASLCVGCFLYTFRRTFARTSRSITICTASRGRREEIDGREQG